MTDKSRVMEGCETSLEERLRASRRRVLASADAERREIERTLHDDVQQDLIALAVKLQLARRLADTDPAAKDALLDEIGRDVHGALEAVRALADRIYPSVLASRGLSEALRAAASAAGVSIRIDAQAVGRYAQEVEEGVYFCCREALESAAARGGRATVEIWQENGVLRFDVIGDCGFDPALELPQARDRAEALGGWLAIASEPDGRPRVSAAIPL